MIQNIIWVSITCAIGVIVPALLGYLLGRIKSYKKREKNQEEALKCLLRSNITSKYYVYKKIGAVPRYEKENVNYMYTQYKNMGGNSYIDLILQDFNSMPLEEVSK